MRFRFLPANIVHMYVYKKRDSRISILEDRYAIQLAWLVLASLLK